MKEMEVIIVIDVLGTIPEGLIRGLEELEIGVWAYTIQTTAWLSSARIVRSVLETWGDLLSLKSQLKLGVKNPLRILLETDFSLT